MTSQPKPEAEFRKPGFTPGKRIRLHDGQEWEFPEPELSPWCFHCIEAEDGSVGRIDVRRHSLDDKIEQAMADWRQGDMMAQIGAGYMMATAHLNRNYYLSPDARSALLPFIPESDENQEMWEQITRWCMGLDGPKQEPAG